MSLSSFKSYTQELEDALVNVLYSKADIRKKPTDITLNIRERKIDSYKATVSRNMVILKKKVWELSSLASLESNREILVALLNKINELDRAYNMSEPKEMLFIIEEIYPLLSKLKEAPGQQSLDLSVPKLHPDIKDEVEADMKELGKCYELGCYRSVVIICGRILETALHRKYFEITGHDALEKSPGIGLGKLIAKLSEKNIEFDPGLMQQIHLINQVRVYSVHKKQTPFSPTQAQAHAIILFTLDSVRKIF